MGSELEFGRWLSSADMERVEPDDIWESARLLVDGMVKHPFSDSTRYDVLLDDDRRLAPKALFGVAARRALSRAVRPSHFRGGEGAPCFRAIRAAGFRIVEKAEGSNVPVSPEERNWIEGEPIRRYHVHYERDPRAVREKSLQGIPWRTAGMRTMRSNPS